MSVFENSNVLGTLEDLLKATEMKEAQFDECTIPVGRLALRDHKLYFEDIA